MRSVYQSYLRRINRRLKLDRDGHLREFKLYLPYVEAKSGIEIGGPSDVFRKGNLTPVYEIAERVDNCDFSKANIWTQHHESFVFNIEKAAGSSLFCEGSALDKVPDSTYDFVLSSHNLEHFANPVRALKEWQRVLKPGGALVLALPYYRDTFDHNRQPTSVGHMFADFEQDIGEDDLTHLPEILEKHDLTRDLAAGSKEDFRKRSLQNFSNRCLHHHVFDEVNSRELLSRTGFEVLFVETAVAPHICILARLA